MFGKSESFELDKLRVGFTFKFQKVEWEILEVGEYDWRGDGRSIEYKIQSKNNEIAYLEVERYRGDIEVYFSEEITIDSSILENAIQEKSMIYLAKEFSLEENYRGVYKNITNSGSWEDLESYIFYKKDMMFTIEKWADGSYASFCGMELKKSAIKNIKAN